MFRHLFILILLFSLHSNASNEILQTKDFGNLTITETNNQVMVAYKNQTVLEIDYSSCALCGGVYVLHSKHRDDVKWIESGHPLLDDQILSGLDFQKIKPYEGFEKQQKVIGLFTAGAGASGLSGSNTAYHIDIHSGEVREETFSYDYYREFFGISWPRLETVVKHYGPEDKT